MAAQNLTEFEKATCEQLISYKIATITGETESELQHRIDQQVLLQN